jgi:hypothetical protein
MKPSALLAAAWGQLRISNPPSSRWTRLRSYLWLRDGAHGFNEEHGDRAECTPFQDDDRHGSSRFGDMNGQCSQRKGLCQSAVRAWRCAECQRRHAARFRMSGGAKRFYHGTRADLKPGDLIGVGVSRGFAQRDRIYFLTLWAPTSAA